MSFDTYTANISLTQKAQFWSNYVSALKGDISSKQNYFWQRISGSTDLYASDPVDTRTWYPSITETCPDYSDLRKEFGKIEDQMLSRKRAATPLTPVLPNAHDRWEKKSIFRYHDILSYLDLPPLGLPMSPFMQISTEPSKLELLVSPKWWLHSFLLNFGLVFKSLNSHNLFPLMPV